MIIFILITTINNAMMLLHVLQCYHIAAVIVSIDIFLDIITTAITILIIAR